MNAAIFVPSVYAIDNPSAYKVHLASWNGKEHPLDVFVRSWDEWQGWNRYRGQRDDFNREFIFSLIDFHHQSDRWLFGGAYRVTGRDPERYDIELLPESEPYIGRLKLVFKRPGRAKALKLENHYESLVVAEILPEPYTGESFPGYDRIHTKFAELENLMKYQRQDWKTSLENAKGVYLITDHSTGKCYIGAAYGDTGIWPRWQGYIFSGHGDNVELTKLIGLHGLDYARNHFHFTLLEYFPMKTSDEVVTKREGYWKNVLLTRRSEFGYNKN